MSVGNVRARGLGKRFGGVVALHGVDLDVAPGGAMAVLGPNGAGKSTLLRLLGGLAQPTAGSVEIGAPATSRRDRHAARRSVGFVGHATWLYPELSARENLVFAGRLHSVPEAGRRAERILEEHGLTTLGGRRARAFSRGTAQRVSIARALIHDPPVLLLDEPFTGLDGAAADSLAQRLKALRDAGRTLLLVTHDIERARLLADSVLVLSRGRVSKRAEGESMRSLDLAREAAGKRASSP